MAGVTRVNGFGKYAQGTVYSTAQVAAFIITTQAALTTEDDGANEAMEAIIREVAPLMYYSADTSATISVIVDGHKDDAASLQARIRALGNAVGPNNVDLTAVTVAAAASMTVA